jgi:hypothetical protein
MEEQKGKFNMPLWLEILIFNVIMMLPASFFWMSLLLRLGLGTDYFFDIVFEEMGKSWWGNVALNTMVIFLPGIAVGINGIVYLHRRAGLTRWMMALGMFLLAGGFLAAVKKF